jgi:hypothetical protein
LAVVATLLWPTELVAEVLALVVTDAGGNSGAPIPSAIIIAISLALNAAIYVGIGLILCLVCGLHGFAREFIAKLATWS